MTCPITADRDAWRGAVTQADRDLRAAIWNTLGHDLKLGRSLTRFGMARFNETVDALVAAQRQQAEAASKAREDALVEALTPSGDTKAAYHGEFSFSEERYDPEADEYYHERVYVPWTTVKEVMAAILARAHTAAEGDRPDA